MSVNRLNQNQGLLGNVKCAETSIHVTIGSPPAEIDGITLNSGDRVLLTAQNNPVENGIYIFSGAALIRPLDENLASGYKDLPIGSHVFVVEGTTNGETEWTLESSIHGGFPTTQLDGYEQRVVTIDSHEQTYGQSYPVTGGGGGGGGTVQGINGDIRATDEGTLAATINRGNNSVDLQTVRNQTTQVALGNQSGLFAGHSNTAAGARSVVLGGINNVANGTQGIVAGGQGNVATTGGIFSASGCETSGSGPLAIGGSGNIISGNWSAAFGGLSSTITSVRSATIVGSGNTVSHNDSVLLGMANFATDAAATTYVRNLYVQTGLRLPTGSADGHVLTSDATGTATWAPSTGGQVDTIVAGTNITVDNSDPVNPVITAAGGGGSGGTVQGAFETYDISAVANTSAGANQFLRTGATASASTDRINSSSHGLLDGTKLTFTTLTGGAGLSTGVDYYCVENAGNWPSQSSFKVSLTQGGAAVDITADYSVVDYVSEESPRGEHSVDLQTSRNNPLNVAATYQSGILSGGGNGVIEGALNSVIAGGSGNQIFGSNAQDNVICGGAANNIRGGANKSTIGGGYFNIHYSGTRSTIGGGDHNYNYSSYSTIGGGENLEISTGCNNSSILGGWLNEIKSGTHNTIGGGSNNKITVGTTGYNSILGGDRNQIVSGSHSVIVGGELNFASANRTVVSGTEAKSSHQGGKVHSAGMFANYGDAQDGKYIVRNSTTDATATELFLDGTSLRMVIPAEFTFAFSIRLSAYNTTDNIGSGWNITGAIRRDNANNTSLIGSTVTQTYTEEAMSGCVVAVTADDTNESLAITVNGLAAKTIRWTATVDTTETGFTLR